MLNARHDLDAFIVQPRHLCEWVTQIAVLMEVMYLALLSNRKRMRHRFYIAATTLLVVAIIVPISGQTNVSETTNSAQESITAGTTFRIGGVLNNPDTKVDAELILQLKDFLESRPGTHKVIAEAGFQGIEVQSFEAHRLLVEAMDAEQVDLAFCSSLDYISQPGNYRAVFQLRLPNDHPGRGRLYHYGSIFVNNRSPLFGLKKDEAQARLPKFLAAKEIALVGPNSASGYIYPYLKLSDLAGTTPLQIRTWGSSEEVVKAVINGIAPIGACDAGAVDEVLAERALLPYRNDLIKEVARTEPLPRDPVALLNKWSPERSEVGREIVAGVKAFFDQLPGNMPRVQPSSDEQQFFELRGSVELFKKLKKGREPF